jgi:hypothetical protein
VAEQSTARISPKFVPTVLYNGVGICYNYKNLYRRLFSAI